MTISFKGLDEFQRKLEKISGTHQVSYYELLTSEFMIRFTTFASVDEMFDKSGFKLESNEDLENIPDDEWDTFIATNTQFPTWEDMLSLAMQDYIQKLLGE